MFQPVHRSRINLGIVTNLEAIKSAVAGYPLPDNTFNRVLIDRGITASAVYAGKTEAFELAVADIYMQLATSANISEGGYNVSLSDKKILLQNANDIYTKYNRQEAVSPTVDDMTSRW